jgi:hypothetical protein
MAPNLPLGVLTLSDIAGLVAVLGVLLVPLAWYLRWIHGQVKSLQDRVRAAEAREAALAGAAARGFAAAANTLAFEAGAIERLLKGRSGEIDADDFVRLLSELREAVTRAWAEASVLSDDGPALRSALRQIDALLGDETSVRLAQLRRDRQSETSHGD